MTQRTITLSGGRLAVSNDAPLALIAGPCVIESGESAYGIATSLKKIAADLGVPFIFKASYDKANRSSISSFRGPGIAEGLRILARIRSELALPVLTDVHTPEEAAEAAKAVDILQIPAFLCRQTDLVVACAQTGLPVNVKKGQFLAPDDMGNIAAKIGPTGNDRILFTERGTTFGYHNLVVDMRSLAIMRETGYPVVFDATHSVQLPGGRGTSTGGQREFILPLARAAVSQGIAAVFVETHPDPEKALSDGANSLALDDVPRFLDTVVRIDRLVKEMARASGDAGRS